MDPSAARAPSAFVQPAGYVGLISGTLGMSEPGRVELEPVAQGLPAEASSTTLEPGRILQLATQLKDKLVDAGTTIAATMGVQMAEQALGTLVQLRRHTIGSRGIWWSRCRSPRG
ncbi:hypothetical protein [Streptomyces syringium]|uniref:hypothetical protein n=1 Tax=Streptomyces syringium TaxID=76729 RepID=UPI003AAB87B9